MGDVEEIVRGLSAAVRYAIIHCDRPRPAYALAQDYDGRKVRRAILTSGLFEKVATRGGALWFYELNETGLRVRDHLLSSKERE